MVREETDGGPVTLVPDFSTFELEAVLIHVLKQRLWCACLKSSFFIKLKLFEELCLKTCGLFRRKVFKPSCLKFDGGRRRST